MKKNVLSLIIVINFSIFSFGQVGINTENPKATLDVAASPTNNSKVDGFIGPRLTGNQLKSKDGLYGSDQIGTIIYATSPANPSTAKTSNVDAPGYYYYDGSMWQKMKGENNNNIITANNGLTKIVDNIQLGGSLVNNTNIALSGNNMNFSGNGNIGIGTSLPTNKLHVSSTSNPLKLEGLLQGNVTNDKLLVVDNYGVVKQTAFENSNVAYLGMLRFKNNVTTTQNAHTSYILDFPASAVLNGATYDATYRRFRITKAGYYQVGVSGQLDVSFNSQTEGSVQLTFSRNGIQAAYTGQYFGERTDYPTFTNTRILYFNAGDYLTVDVAYTRNYKVMNAEIYALYFGQAN